MKLLQPKLDRLTKHLAEGGSEKDAARVLKIRDQETIDEYLAAAKEALGGDEDDEGEPEKPKKSSKKSAKKPAKKTAVVEEEDLDDDDDDDDDDEAPEVEEEDLDDDDDLDDEYPEDLLEEEVKPDPTLEPAKKASEKAVKEKVADLPEKKYFLFDEQGRKQVLEVVSDQPHQAIFKVYQDKQVEIRIGKETVTVSRDKVFNTDTKAIELPNGGVYPTEFVKAAVQLALS